MVEQSTPRRVPVEELANEANFNAAWSRLRQEMDARIAARFGVALDDRRSTQADPELLADMALERALMS